MWICHTAAHRTARKQREKSNNDRDLNDMLLRRHAPPAKSPMVAESSAELGSRRKRASQNGTLERITWTVSEEAMA
jgi:hypothetical protein